MCGIFLRICRPGGGPSPLLRLETVLRNRGPDHNGRIEMVTSEDGLVLEFFSSVLWLQGDRMQTQPVVNGDGDYVLCWNGDVFGGVGVDVTEGQVRIIRYIVLALLHICCKKC